MATAYHSVVRESAKDAEILLRAAQRDWRAGNVQAARNWAYMALASAREGYLFAVRMHGGTSRQAKVARRFARIVARKARAATRVSQGRRR